MRKHFILIFFITIVSYAQSITYINSIGNFSNAVSFCIIPSGNFYVSDNTKNEVYKIDFDGNTVKEVGGYGWKSGLFDEPADVFATELNVYVCDKNNDRIQIFDKNLNYLSEFKTSDNESSMYIFEKPTCFSISNQSDLLVLDSYNKRILKYDLTGNFLQQIGSYDSGEYSLVSPEKFAISPDGKIFVINENKILVFDQYGNGLIQLPINFTIKSIKIYNSTLTVASESKVSFIDLANLSGGFINITINNNSKILEAYSIDSKLYLLTSKTIDTYEITK